jgi:hypothetical protein
VVREVAAPRPIERVRGDLLDPASSRGGEVRATFRLPRGTLHCRVDLRITGETFLRRARVETGESPESLGMVAEGPFVYRIRQEGGQVEHLAIPYPRSEASRVRITLVPEGPDPTQRLTITEGWFSCPPVGGGEAPVERVPLAIESTIRDEAAKATVVTLDAGAEGLPIEALWLDVATPELSRRVEVHATTYREVWPPAGGGMVYRIAPRPGVVLESMRVPMRPTRKRWVRLTVHDGDSAPLEIRGVQAEVRARELIFRAAAAGEHRLYVGDRAATAPYYDLAAILEREQRAEAPRAVTLGPVEANPRLGQESAREALPFTERYRRTIGAALAAVLLGLSVWAARMLRRGDGEAAEGE